MVETLTAVCVTLENGLPGIGEAEKFEFAIPLRQNAPSVTKMRKRDRDRAEALRLAGGPKPTLRDRAVALARERGDVRTAELTAIGISPLLPGPDVR